MKSSDQVINFQTKIISGSIDFKRHKTEKAIQRALLIIPFLDPNLIVYNIHYDNCHVELCSSNGPKIFTLLLAVSSKFIVFLSLQVGWKKLLKKSQYDDKRPCLEPACLVIETRFNPISILPIPPTLMDLQFSFDASTIVLKE